MVVDLGSHVIPDVDQHLSKRLIRPRQTVSSASTLATLTATPTSSLSFAAPTATATSKEISGNVSFAQIQTTLFPPDSSIVDLVPQLQSIQGFELKCANCSMQGQIQLRAAGFSIDSSDIGQIMDFIDDGYFEFNAIGMSANMAFDFDFQPGFAVAVPFIPQLPEIQLSPFGIPGVITFGPSLQLLFPMQIVLNSAVRFSTGFTLAIPDNSTLVLNVSHVGSSYSTGFQDAVLTELPFDVNAENLSLNFTVGFRPQLLLSPGITSTSETFYARGGVGAFLDLPSYTATVSAVKDKAENCVDPAPSNEKNTRILIEPSVSVGGGVLWEMELGITNNISLILGAEEGLFETTYPLPTQCLLFDRKTSSISHTSSDGAQNNGGGRLGATTGPALFILFGVSFLSLF